MIEILQASGIDSLPVVAGEVVENVVVKTTEMSLWQLFKGGGWLMWVLLLLGCVTVFIFVERFVAIMRAQRLDVNFMKRIRSFVVDGRVKEAISFCRKEDTPIARMVEKGLERLGRPMSDVQNAIENVANLEVSKLENGLPFLATIAGGAPMIGFLGTVAGMIEAFFQMSNAGNNIDVSSLAGGIYTAMVTTLGGLFVGIIAYFAYNYLTTLVDKVVRDMEARSLEFMDILNEPAN